MSISMWPHFWHLLIRSAGMAASALGYKPLGIAVSIAAFLADFTLFIYLSFRGLGREEMNKQWKQGLKYATISTICVGLFVIIIAWLAGIIATVYEDHQFQVSVNTQIVAENRDLTDKLKDSQRNAEQRCEQARGEEIKRLKKQITAVCYNPDRHLDKMDTDKLFSELKKVREAMEQQHQIPKFRITGFVGDAESWRFIRELQPIFENAGWKWDSPSYTDMAKAMAKEKAEHTEQEEWVKSHFPLEGVIVFDKNCPKCFGTSVATALGRVGLWSDWTQNQALVKDFPHLDVLTVWVGYKPILARQAP